MPPSQGSRQGDAKEGSREAALQPWVLGCSLERKQAGGENCSTFSRMNEWMKFKRVRKWMNQGSSCVTLAGRSGLVWGLLTSIYWLLFGRSCCSKLMEIDGRSMAIGYCFYSGFSALSWFSSIGCKSFLETQHVLAYIVCRGSAWKTESSDRRKHLKPQINCSVHLKVMGQNLVFLLRQNSHWSH